MKLLFILTYYTPHWTGLTQYARRLAEGLATKQYDVTVLTTQHEKNLSPEENICGVRVKRKRVLFRISRTLISFALVVSFWREIKNNDKVIVYLPFAEVGLVAVICKILGKKLILVHNGDLVLPPGLFNRILEAFYFGNTKMAMALSSEIVIQTRDYAEHSHLLSSFRLKWREVLPLFPEQKRGVSEKLIQNKLDPRRTYTVGFGGRFVEEKGFDILLSAIPYVLEKLPRTQFVFSGETNVGYENFFQQKKALVEKTEEHLVFLGRLTEDEMRNFYTLIDVFVISSRSDCYPSVGVEAMLRGVPLVVTNIPGARMQVKDTGMGVVVEVNNVRSLAEGIIEVLRNKTKYTRNIARVKQIYDFEKTIRDYQKILG